MKFNIGRFKFKGRPLNHQIFQPYYGNNNIIIMGTHTHTHTHTQHPTWSQLTLHPLTILTTAALVEQLPHLFLLHHQRTVWGEREWPSTLRGEIRSPLSYDRKNNTKTMQVSSNVISVITSCCPWPIYVTIKAPIITKVIIVITTPP